MKRKNLSVQAIQKTIARLSDPKVNYAVLLASTPEVAKDIIESLPGVKRLRQSGPEAAKAVLALLQKEETLRDDRLSAISLHILENYPSNDVKVTLASYINARMFTGLNSQLAAETFLKAAGIQALRKDAIAVALREAIKIQPSDPAKVRIDQKRSARQPRKPFKKKVPAAAKK